MKFKYQVTQLESYQLAPDLDAHLNAEGQSGWELCYFTASVIDSRFIHSDTPQSCVCVFRRSETESAADSGAANPVSAATQSAS